MNWDVSTWVSVCSAALALMSVIASWMIAARQAELQYEGLRAGMDQEVAGWSHEAIDQLASASSLAKNRATLSEVEFRTALSEASWRLSALADRGRLFFPNERPDLFGPDRERAFRGIRPPVLDALVFACCQLEQLRNGGDHDNAAAEFLVKCRRLLVSEAQNAVDPRRRKAMLRRLASGRKNDEESSFKVACDLAVSLNERHPDLPAVVAFLNAYHVIRGNA